MDGTELYGLTTVSSLPCCTAEAVPFKTGFVRPRRKKRRISCWRPSAQRWNTLNAMVKSELSSFSSPPVYAANAISKITSSRKGKVVSRMEVKEAKVERPWIQQNPD